jgi:hypothetical protein
MVGNTNIISCNILLDDLDTGSCLFCHFLMSQALASLSITLDLCQLQSVSEVVLRVYGLYASTVFPEPAGGIEG